MAGSRCSATESSRCARSPRLFGTLSILLVFWVARELLIDPYHSAANGLPDADAYLAAAIAALIFAVSLVMLKYSRELRMYSMMLAILLAQLGFFIRASRRGGIGNYIGAAALCRRGGDRQLFRDPDPGGRGDLARVPARALGFSAVAAESRRAWAIAIALAIAGGRLRR